VRGLLLRRWSPEDLDALHRAVLESIGELRPWMVWASSTDIEAQRAYLQTAVPAWEKDERYEYAIEDPAAGVIGSIGLLARIGAGGLEIGYWVHSGHTRQGIATTCAAALTAAAFSLPWVERVEIHHDKSNRASGAVPSKLGFEVVERFARLAVAPADSGHDLIWRLRRDQYPGSRAQLIAQSLEAEGRGA